MPFKLIHHKDDTYGVKNMATSHWKSKHTTKAKAEAQLRLLEGVIHNWSPAKKKKDMAYVRSFKKK